MGPTLLKREFAEILERLADNPYAGPAVAGEAGVRRILIRRTHHHIYYEVDPSRHIVKILAFWHTSRGEGPPL